MATMRYDDYIAKIDYEEESGLFHGRVINIRDVVNFYGSSADELRTEFQNSMDAYLEVCKEEGIEPDRPFSGRFNVRMQPELHRAVADASAVAGKSINKWVIDVLADAAKTYYAPRGKASSP
ncbi:MAG: type II toxin-antitoxin system HicB family antitoxin [bacterium]|nr:type II toxin-antitoxin system HicB family antitoxin [bacterium]